MSDNTTSSSSPQQSIYHSVINSKIHAKNLVTSPKKLSKLVHSQQRSRHSQPPGGDRALENNSYLSGGENAIESGHEISAPNLERISSRLSTNLSALKPEYDEHSEQEEEGDIVETDIEQQLGVENDEEDEDKSEDESENENRNRKKNGNEDSDEENSETQSQQSNLVFSTLLSEDSEDYSSLFNHGAEGNGYYARNGSNNNVFINVLFKYIFIANCIIYFYIGVSSMFNDQDKEKDRESRRNLTLLLLGSIIYSCVFSMMIFWTLSLTHAISRRLVAGWIWIITISVPVACLYTFFISAYTLFVTKPDWQSKYSNIVLLVSTLGLLIRSFKYVLYIKTVTGTINKAIDLFLFVFNTFLSYDFSSSPPVQPGQNLNVETGMSREDNIEGNSYNDRLLHQESQPQPQPKHKHKPQRGQQTLEEEEHNSPMSVPETTKKRRATNHYLSFALFNFALSVGFSLFLVPNSIISVLGLAYVICFLIQLERFITSVSRRPPQPSILCLYLVFLVCNHEFEHFWFYFDLQPCFASEFCLYCTFFCFQEDCACNRRSFGDAVNISIPC
ncbi:hypothetical protein AX774_g3166 [Zancudomyces culisetae]|uniref:Uncharacterized protein n=1 Tax=Zancudomyces culisetae TaxID=1213189 RepID=A0A1R1PQT8_ZANCU|nr:hypothetical protein AX774_g3166 [Zancudomyces culisetae]|eukprot:OMH83324.1 hypothetical protein AX774_g3166 [Zancudomyces culisetae]